MKNKLVNSTERCMSCGKLSETSLCDACRKLNKITVIDLLNKIANGEEIPKKIKYKNRIFELKNNCFKYCYINNKCELLEDVLVLENLNDEIEILEELPITKLTVNGVVQYDLTKDKKIEKLNFGTVVFGNYEDFVRMLKIQSDKIDEIIDKITEMGDNND